eukprot:scaffold67052_cov27-Tisochrysis_lutea.AAC.2
MVGMLNAQGAVGPQSTGADAGTRGVSAPSAPPAAAAAASVARTDVASVTYGMPPTKSLLAGADNGRSRFAPLAGATDALPSLAVIGVRCSPPDRADNAVPTGWPRPQVGKPCKRSPARRISPSAAGVIPRT